MQTSELGIARTIAAHLTLESERILREGSSTMLSSMQVKTMLTTVASNHLRKLARVSTLERADGLSAAEGRRSDLVMGWSLRLKAARGPHATVEAGDHASMVASGLSEVDIPDVDRTIRLLRENAGLFRLPRKRSRCFLPPEARILA